MSFAKSFFVQDVCEKKKDSSVLLSQNRDKQKKKTAQVSTTTKGKLGLLNLLSLKIHFKLSWQVQHKDTSASLSSPSHSFKIDNSSFAALGMS